MEIDQIINLKVCTSALGDFKNVSVDMEIYLLIHTKSLPVYMPYFHEKDSHLFTERTNLSEQNTLIKHINNKRK